MAVDEPKEMIDAELDSILDDALADFSKPMPSASAPLPGQTEAAANGGGVGSVGVLTEEAIQKATQDFETKMRAIMIQQQKVASQQATLESQQTSASADSTTQITAQSLASEFANFAAVAARAESTAPGGATTPTPSTQAPAASGTAPPPAPDFQNLLSDVMQQMAQNNKEFQSAPSPGELTQMLQDLGLGGGGGGGGGEDEAGNLFPLMQTMLENILCKEILYPPIKEIVDKYPDWLADNRATTDTTEFDRYSRQFDIMKKVVELFESEKESDSDEVKSKRFETLIEYMQKLQEEGHPPVALAGDASGGNLADLLSGGGLVPGMAAAPASGSDEQCSLM